MLKDKATMELASRLVEIATGEPWGDGCVVTDIIHGYASPRYGLRDATIVLGNWNTRDKYDPTRETPLTKDETLPARLARVLERVGAEVEWLDEWTSCSECYRAIRTKPDSYGWKPEFAWLGDCDIVCSACLLEDVAGSIDAGGYVNDPTRAITWCSDAELERAGWTQWAPDRILENGWHPGQDDDPAKVLEEIRRETSADVVFRIQDAGQFDVKFRAYTRDADTEAEAEAEADN